MTRDEHLNVIAAEECMEIAQRFSKLLRFGLEQVQPNHDAIHPENGNPEGLDNGDRVLREYADLVGVMEMLGYDVDPLPQRLRLWADAKKAKIERFLAYSAKCGTLTEIP